MNNALAPGYFETKLNDDFFREPTGQALLLASEAGSYMTGSVIVADGGHVISTF